MVSTKSLARKYNSATILDHLRLHAPRFTRRTGEIYRPIAQFGIRIVDQLLSENLIHEIGAQQEKIGRPGTLIELNPAGARNRGEIRVDFVSVILTDFIARIQWRKHVDLPDEAGIGCLPGCRKS